MSKRYFTKVAILLRHGFSPVNLLRIFKTSFYNNTCGRLFLIFAGLNILLRFEPNLFK